MNTLQVVTNFEIGRRIVEHEQRGEKRASYGQELLKLLSTRLSDEFGKGFSKSNLEYMRRFYLEWRHHDSLIAQKASGQSPMRQTRKKATGELAPFRKVQSSFTTPPFVLSWSHYVLLLTIKNPGERSFYEIEAAREGWSVP